MSVPRIKLYYTSLHHQLDLTTQSGFKPVSLEATDYAVRAWPGGVGDKKLGANYAPCVLPQLQASKRGFHQNLWLFGDEGFITEVGTMNAFLYSKIQLPVKRVSDCSS